ncbi:hypothetical protein TI05_00895 [Achromatium sp. WMS3]|nr:hypothetical protein TI05_00895 [Achromatium sp. WMS3]
MDTTELKEVIRAELPNMVRKDPNFRLYLLELTRTEYADRLQTQDQFQQILAELRHDREIQARKWEENNQRWEQFTAEQARKWEESRQEFKQVHEEIMSISKKHNRAIGALGARWGMQSERSFRNALAGILEQSFGVQVLNVEEQDETGTVFGYPEQIELDIIVKNGLLIICELKSSISKNDMYIFERKVRFYEQRHNRKADRLIVISPMVATKAQTVAKSLNIEVYSDADEIS